MNAMRRQLGRIHRAVKIAVSVSVAVALAAAPMPSSARAADTTQPAPTTSDAENRLTVEDRSIEQTKPIALPADAPPISAGPFEPTYESLKAYKCPTWYAQAKFGIWAHWGPQGVPEIGDWFARNLYVQGSGDYRYQVAHYGHPSKVGYKDIIQLWKAEKFDPDYLMSLYKAAGAHYFVSMACHHDNFDLWNSKYHRWNAVQMGPHKDIVGLWRAAALKQGLHFGISEHMAASYKWFSVAHSADATGPLAGVPYDANNPVFADLYGPKPLRFYQPDADLWSENNIPDSWKLEWYLRCRDVIDAYKPDYVYSDFGNVPFRHEVGWKLLADYYNSSIQNHGGNLEAVYTGKGDTQRVYVRDFESGCAGDVQPEPWQMDMCINSFFYYRDTKTRPYTKADRVLRLLCDVVSKNGNLLLNIPQRPDGTIDDEELAILTDMADWMKVNSEAIFGTHPFKIYGEGPTVISDFRKHWDYTPQDIRFTVADDTLYATVLGKPDGAIVIPSLGVGCNLAQGHMSSVNLLGYDGSLKWSITDKGLAVELPADAALSPIASVLRISGLKNLQWDGSIYPARDGGITLSASAADRHGDTFLVVPTPDGSQVRQWTKPSDYLSWNINFIHPGDYRVQALYSAPAPSAITLKLGDHESRATLPSTAGWEDSKIEDATVMHVASAGAMELSLAPQNATDWRPINLTKLMLTPVQ